MKKIQILDERAETKNYPEKSGYKGLFCCTV